MLSILLPCQEQLKLRKKWHLKCNRCHIYFFLEMLQSQSPSYRFTALKVIDIVLYI